MTVWRFDPGLNETQQWERSRERNSPSQGRQRAIERRDQIRAGNGSEEDASRDRGGPWPLRETPNAA